MKNIVELECDNMLWNIIKVISILFYHNLLLFRSENVLQFDILPSFPEKLSRLPVTLSIYRCTLSTVPLDLNFTYARVQKATARNIHCNAPE